MVFIWLLILIFVQTIFYKRHKVKELRMLNNNITKIYMTIKLFIIALLLFAPNNSLFAQMNYCNGNYLKNELNMMADTTISSYSIGDYKVNLIRIQGVPRVGIVNNKLNNAIDTIEYLDTNIEVYPNTIFIPNPQIDDDNIYFSSFKATEIVIIDAVSGNKVINYMFEPESSFGGTIAIETTNLSTDDLSSLSGALDETLLETFGDRIIPVSNKFETINYSYLPTSIYIIYLLDDKTRTIIFTSVIEKR